jgi:3-oxoacyl-[acyl-carrier protein] reductase
LVADIAAHGAYYGVVANAGVHSDAAFPAMTEEQWDGVLRTNLDAFYNVLQPLIMPMVRRRAPGRIVTLASVSGIIGNRGQVNYAAAKGALHAASRSLAREVGSRGLTVNCVSPGLVDTPMSAGLFEPAAIERMVPLQRMGRPEEIAAAVAFLASDAAGYITGQVVPVNGGMT